MPFVPAGSNPKPVLYEVENDADLVVASQPYATLTSLTPQGFGTGVVGYILAPGDPAINLANCIIYSRGGNGGTAGRLFVLTQGTSSRVLVLITEGSVNGNAVASSGADIVLVVAKAAKYTSPALSSAVFATITLAAAQATALGGATVLVLDDTYAESFTLTNGVNLVGFGSRSGGGVLINGTITLPNASVNTLRNLQVNGGAGAAVTDGANSATLNAFSCAFAGTSPCLAVDTVTLDGCTVTTGCSSASLTSQNSTYTAAIAPVIFNSFNDTFASNAVCTGAVSIRSSRITGNLASTTLTARDTSVTGTLTSTVTTINNCTIGGAATTTGATTCESTDFLSLSVTGAGTLNDCRFSTSLAVTAAAILTACTVGTTSTFGLSIAAQGCVFTGASSLSGNSGSLLRSCQFGSSFTDSGSGADVAQMCNFTGAFSGNATTLSACFMGGTTAVDGVSSAYNTVFVGAVTSTVAAMQAFNSTFRAAAGFFHAQIMSQNAYLATVTVNNSSGGALTHLFQGCCFTPVAGNSITTTTANDLVVLAGGYSNAPSNLLTNGVGSTQFIGHVAGGNRVSTDLTALSRSDMRILSHTTVAMGDVATDLQTSIGATTAVSDFYIIDPGGASAPVLTIYPGTELPDGFEFHIRNISATDSFSLAASAGETFDSAATVLIGPGDIRHYVYTRASATVVIYEII